MNDVVAVMSAPDFAARKHATQRRKGEAAEPYLNHLIEVANLAAEASDGRADVVIAALLHDVVEDQGVTIDEVAALFGSTVAFIVAEVTDDKSLPKQVRRAFRFLDFEDTFPNHAGRSPRGGNRFVLRLNMTVLNGADFRIGRLNPRSNERRRL